MKYALLIYYDESTQADPSSPEAKEVFDHYRKFTESINERGINKGGEALHPTGAATTVRVRSGETLTTDGPFAETKEALAGFYLIDVADLDDAIKVAAELPGSWYGSVEIRPIVDWENEAAG